MEQLVVDPDPLVDAHGNLLIIKTEFSTTTGVATEVTLISNLALEQKDSYPGMFTKIRKGEVAVYAIQRVPAQSAGISGTLNLAALVTGSGSLPAKLVTQPLTGKIDLMRIDHGASTDVIYLIQTTSSGRFVLVYEFNGTAFSEVGTAIPLS